MHEPRSRGPSHRDGHSKLVTGHKSSPPPPRPFSDLDSICPDDRARTTGPGQRSRSFSVPDPSRQLMGHTQRASEGRDESTTGVRERRNGIEAATWMRGVRGSAASFPIRIRPSCYSPSPTSRHVRASSLRRRLGYAAPTCCRASWTVVPPPAPLPCGSDLPLSSPSRAQALSPIVPVTPLSKFIRVVFPLTPMPEPTQPSDLRTAALP